MGLPVLGVCYGCVFARAEEGRLFSPRGTGVVVFTAWNRGGGFAVSTQATPARGAGARLRRRGAPGRRYQLLNYTQGGKVEKAARREDLQAGAPAPETPVSFSRCGPVLPPEAGPAALSRPLRARRRWWTSTRRRRCCAGRPRSSAACSRTVTPSRASRPGLRPAPLPASPHQPSPPPLLLFSLPLTLLYSPSNSPPTKT